LIAKLGDKPGAVAMPQNKFNVVYDVAGLFKADDDPLVYYFLLNQNKAWFSDWTKDKKTKQTTNIITKWRQNRDKFPESSMTFQNDKGENITVHFIFVLFSTNPVATAFRLGSDEGLCDIKFMREWMPIVA
jgi:hypothetical protein